jgi:heat shock protein HslJ
MRPLRTSAVLFTGLAVLLALSACASDSGTAASPSPSADPLTDSSWVLQSVLVADALAPSVSDASLNFGAGGQLSGSTGCNRFTGTWSGSADALTLTIGATTQMACMDPQAQAQEQAVLGQLPLATAATVGDGTLTLQDDGGQDLAVYASAVTGFAGTSWQVTGVNNGKGAVVSTEATASLTLVFGDEGSVSGFGGCTRFSGTATFDSGSVAFTDLAPDEECTGDEAAAAQQSEYLAALANATTPQIDGNQVTLRDGEGATQVSLVKQ